MKEFKDRVAVITGSASGMGRAVAERAAREGMKVVLADVEQKALEEAESELRAEGAEVLAVRTDVTKPEALQELARKTLDRFGAVHLLHNNAGVGGGAAFWETSLRDWKWIMGVNFWGPIYGIWAFLPIMLKQDTECHIVSTSSMGGLIVSSYIGTPYGVSKFGVVALSETLYHELKLIGSKVGVSVLCPGNVNTRIGNGARNRPVDLANDPEWDERIQSLPHVTSVRNITRALNDAAMSPTEVADVVFEGIKEDRFYLFPSPEMVMSAMDRGEDLLHERQPFSPTSVLTG